MDFEGTDLMKVALRCIGLPPVDMLELVTDEDYATWWEAHKITPITRPRSASRVGPNLLGLGGGALSTSMFPPVSFYLSSFPKISENMSYPPDFEL